MDKDIKMQYNEIRESKEETICQIKPINSDSIQLRHKRSSLQRRSAVRLVYNHWLDRKISQYKEDQTTLSYTFCAKELTEMKKNDQYAFLKEVDSISLQQSSSAVAPPSGSGIQELLQSAEKRISTIQIQKKQKEQLFDRMRQSEHPPVRRLFETAEDRTGQGEAA